MVELTKPFDYLPFQSRRYPLSPPMSDIERAESPERPPLGSKTKSQTRSRRRGVSLQSTNGSQLGQDDLRILTQALSSRRDRKTQSVGDDHADELLRRIFGRGGASDSQHGVRFKGLTVDGRGFGAAEAVSMTTIASFLLWPPNIIKQIQKKKRTPVRHIIDDFSGVVEAGEMVLVLGKPGSGCTTFLKAVSGYDAGFERVTGDVSYSGITQNEMKRHYRAEVTFNAEVDLHFATINVKETLDFAIKCRTPHKADRLEDESRQDFRQTFRTVLGAVFGLDRVFKTKVGNEFIRGVSGGEKKRVSIAETLTSRAKVQAWDSATRGLDSSTALEYVRALRACTNMSGAAMLVALYQVSDELTKQFDKIIVIEGGKQIYFGPVGQAQEYFESLGFVRPPRQPLADYLSSIGDINARSIRDGFADKVPRTAEQFQRVFRESHFWRDTLAEVERWDANMPKHDAATVHNRSSFALSFPAQVVALARRQYLIQLGDPVSLAARYVAAIFQAIIIGSLFLNIPQTTNGAFLYGGVMFFSLLFNSLLSMSELTAAFSSQPILAKQKAFAFYRPSAWSLAVVLADLPILALQIVIFGMIIYLMSHLQRTASQFFIFCLILYATVLCISAFFRTLAALAPSLNAATPLSGLGIQILIVYTGYLIPYSQMPYWLRELYWLNPLSYGFEALQTNQFYNLELACVGNSFVPYGPTYTSNANRVCTLAGARPGEPFVNGADYIAAQFGYTRSHLWRNFGAIIGYWICFLILGAIFNEIKLRGGNKSGADVVQFARGKTPAGVQEALENGDLVDDVETAREADRGNGSKITDEEEKARQEKIDKEAEKHLVKHESIFSWHHIKYDIGSGASKKRLLSDISGFAKPGVLTALMGESGAGKTTLLTALSQRVTSGVITGDIFVDGRDLLPSFARNIGFCEQADVHETFSTVREALVFSATLRQTGSREQKERYVDEIIALLELEPIADAIIGTPGKGLNVEQRKRLTIGVELAAKPDLLIFLDEPTSGLDANAAQSVVRFLRKLTDAGQAIICTIHQPSALLFDQFDALLLLGRGGKTLFFGPTGENSSAVIEYFEKHGARKIPKDYNVAEWMLEVVGAGASAKDKQDWHAIWNKSDDKQLRMSELEAIVSDRRSHTQEDPAARRESYYAASMALQFRMLLRRAFISYTRDVPYIMGKFMLHIISALFNGFTFLKLGTAVIDLQNRLFTTFLSVTILPPLVQQLQPRFIAARDLFEAREGKARIYSWLPLTITSIIVEIPWHLFAGTIYWIIWWHMTVRVGGGSAAFSWLTYLVFELFVVSFGQMIAALAPNALFASLLVPFFFSFVVAFCGVLAPPPSIPGFWRAWMLHLTPFRYVLGVQLILEDHDLPINCTTESLLTVIAPAGSTCASYFSAFFADGGFGYLVNPEATDSCLYCQYSVGDQYLSTLQLDWGDRWPYFGYFVAYQPFNWFLVIALTYIFRIKGLTPFRGLFSRLRGRDDPLEAADPRTTSEMTVERKDSDSSSGMKDVDTVPRAAVDMHKPQQEGAAGDSTPV